MREEEREKVIRYLFFFLPFALLPSRVTRTSRRLELVSLRLKKAKQLRLICRVLRLTSGYY